VLSCGQKVAYGYRRIAWGLRRKEEKPISKTEPVQNPKPRHFQAVRVFWPQCAAEAYGEGVHYEL